MIALMVITDGRRDCITRTIPSALEQLYTPVPIAPRIIYDDSGDPDHRQWLMATFGRYGFDIHWHEAGRQGFAGAIATAWARLETYDPARFDYVFHLEDDFTFNQRIPLGSMAAVLDHHPEIAQIALRRQPWNDLEVAAGGVIETNPDAYSEHVGAWGTWLQHRLFFTTNPSLYRRTLIARGWPLCAHSEGVFSARLFEDPNTWSAYWGNRASGEAVHHIGAQRAGKGY